jgi:hypothetical protein
VRCSPPKPKGGSMFVRRLAVGTVVLAIVAAACGGGGLSLEEYFTKMDDLQSSYEQQSQDFQTEVQTALQGATSQEEELAVFKEYLEKSLTAADDQLGEFEALDPPSEAASEHTDLIEAGKAIRSALADVIDRYEEFVSFEEVSQFFTTDLAEVGQRGTDACNALESVAKDNDIQVDLNC